MYCKHCGAEIEEGCKYCRFCGMSVVTLEKMTGDEHIDAIPDAEAEKAMRKRKTGTRAVAILGTFGAVFAAPCAIAGFVMSLIALIMAGGQKKKYGSIAEFSTEMSAAIKKFAKQQVKWFRRDPAVRWIDMTAAPFADACAHIDSFLATALS